MIAAFPRRSSLVRACALAVLVLLLEWSRAIVARQPGLALAALLLGGAALIATALPFSAERLGLGTSKLALRVLGGIALGAALLLPAAVRAGAVPLIPAMYVAVWSESPMRMVLSSAAAP